MVQLKLVPIVIESAQRLISEEFKCMLLKPLYIDESLNKTNNSIECDNKFLRSDYRRCLNSVVFMIATQQEGYLYQFNDAGIIYQILTLLSNEILFIFKNVVQKKTIALLYIRSLHQYIN